jgi:hypothetical protein
MQANLKEGFSRICLLLYACWVVGSLFYVGLYRPLTGAVVFQQLDRQGLDFVYSQCQDRVRAVEAELKSEQGLRELAKDLDGRSRTKVPENPSDSFVPTPYGSDAHGKPLTRDQASALCDSERRRAEDAVDKTSYLRLEYDALLSLSQGGPIPLFVFLAPVLVYYCLLAVAWAGVRVCLWIKRGFTDGADPLR